MNIKSIARSAKQKGFARWAISFSKVDAEHVPGQIPKRKSASLNSTPFFRILWRDGVEASLFPYRGLARIVNNYTLWLIASNEAQFYR